MKQHNTRHETESPNFIKRFRFLWKITAALIILLFAGWALLDAFVIPRDIVAAEDAAGTDDESGYADTSDAVDVLTEPVITDTSYRDDSISIEIRTMRTLDTDVYIADIVLKDPFCLKTALAQDSFGRNITDTTSYMAEQHNAILAINGDYYGFRETGYVMRSSYLYRDVISRDPDLFIISFVKLGEERLFPYSKSVLVAKYFTI